MPRSLAFCLGNRNESSETCIGKLLHHRAMNDAGGWACRADGRDSRDAEEYAGDGAAGDAETCWVG